MHVKEESVLCEKMIDMSINLTQDSFPLFLVTRKELQMKCTIHTAKELVPCKTKYGIRYVCPVGGCTVVLWDGSTSTPADYETRQARIKAHNAFDALWKSGVLTRYAAYNKLAVYLKLPQSQVHIGHFDHQQCMRVIHFSEVFLQDKGENIEI